MTDNPVALAVREELHRIAPDIDIDTVDTKADLREEFDIDSMDFLNLATALCKRLNVSIPEADYHLVESLDAMISYLSDK